MTNIFTRAWNSIKSWVSTNDQTVMVELTLAEHTLLQKFHPLINQILTTLGTQGVQIVEDAFAGVMATAATGGNVGAGIAAAAQAALSQIKTDATSDARNAVYGVLAAAQAATSTLSTTASFPAQPAPATAS